MILPGKKNKEEIFLNLETAVRIYCPLTMKQPRTSQILFDLEEKENLRKINIKVKVTLQHDGTKVWSYQVLNAKLMNVRRHQINICGQC